MLRPTKYTNIELSVVGISTMILMVLSKEKAMKYNDLVERLVKRKGIDVKENFLPALSFLFLLNKINYSKTQDVIELI